MSDELTGYGGGPLVQTHMSAEEKLRMLAAADTTLQGYLSTGGLFRWFDRQLRPGYLKTGACVRIRRVSTVRQYQQQGLSSMSQPLFQLDVIDVDAVHCRTVAAAIIAWLGTVSLAQVSQFDSPYKTPPQFPNFVVNQRSNLEAQLDLPAYVESIDFRAYVDELI